MESIALTDGSPAKRMCGGVTRMGGKFEEIATTLDVSKRSLSPRMEDFGRSGVAFDRLMRRVAETIGGLIRSKLAICGKTLRAQDAV
jgi:hypothetical protein